jgi:hypothetical protein
LTEAEFSEQRKEVICVSDFMTRMKDLGRLFLRSARETGETAAEMIEHKAQIQRLVVQVRRLDKERSNLLSQIGAKVYGLHGQGKIRNQDVLVDCQRIDAIITDIAKLKHDIEQIRAASLEKGIEIPVMVDEAPLTEETDEAASAVVTPAGTTGQQDLPDEELPKASEGRVEFDEAGEALADQAEGPSAAGGDACSAEASDESA